MAAPSKARRAVHDAPARPVAEARDTAIVVWLSPAELRRAKRHAFACGMTVEEWARARAITRPGAALSRKATPSPAAPREALRQEGRRSGDATPALPQRGTRNEEVASFRGRVAALLERDGPLVASEIARRLGQPTTKVQSALWGMRMTGTVVVHGPATPRAYDVAHRTRSSL